MLPMANAKPVIIFIFMAFLLLYEKVGDILHIPKSRYSYAKVILKERKGGYVKSVSSPSDVFTIHRICFEIDNYIVLDLRVPRKTYEAVAVGSRGVLVHTDTRFRGFHMDKKIPDIIKPKKKENKSANKNIRKKHQFGKENNRGE